MKINKGAILRSIEQPHLKAGLPEFRPGDTVRVDTKVTEGNRTRLQAFEGVVIAINNGGARKSFTVRKISFGEGVERVFPMHTPLIDKITVLERGKVRRAKLYYLRDLRGKAARIKSDRSRMMRDAADVKTAKDAAAVQAKADADAATQAAAQAQADAAAAAQAEQAQSEQAQAPAAEPSTTEE